MKKIFALTLAALAVITLIPGLGAAALPGTPNAAAAVSTPVDINTAGVDELVAVRGIGPALAQKIVEMRERIGPFSAIEDLLEVRGIGPKSLEKLRPGLSLTTPPSPVAQSPSPSSLP